MSIEVATYINDLQPVNPPNTDPEAQGAAHLRLIKQVLQNTFLNGTRAVSVPAVYSYSTSSTLTKNNGESTNYIATTSGAITITLPALVALDAGWKTHFIKTSSDVNPIFIKPGSGTINSGGFMSLAQARRCIPGVRSTVIWDGANWFITRVNALPIGCLVDFWGTTIPPGFEWPNGQTLASASTNYPEYYASVGSGLTPDVRGYACIPLDNLGGAAAGHLPTTYITSTTLGAVGGIDHASLLLTNLPAIPVTGSVTTSTTISQNANVYNTSLGASPGGEVGPTSGSATITASSTSTFTGNTTGGSSTAFSNVQPSIMVGKILVVE